MIDINADTKLFGLIGDPVSKSLSPFIHNYVFEKMNFNNSYMAFRIESDHLKNSLDALKTLGARGFNATIPHKIALLELVDQMDPYAKQLQAINTVKIENNRLCGYNTDGPGLIQALVDHGVILDGLNILVLGAGGAARGIALALSLNGCEVIGIINRTISKSEELANMINKMESKASAVVVLPDEELLEYDLVINTTSVGMHPNIDRTPLDVHRLREDAILFDIVYKPHKTRFLEEGEKHGNPIIHGMEMLIYQALIAEEIWMDIKLDKRTLKEELIKLAIEKKLLV